MFAFAVATALTTLPDKVVWSQASDDIRFASLKPVMTEAEVQRLKVGKDCVRMGCGGVADKDGNTISGCDLTYGYQLPGRKQPLGISFAMIGVTAMQKEPDDPLLNGRGGWSGGQSPPPKRVIWTVFTFRVEGGATYKRNKDGLYVAEPKK